MNRTARLITLLQLLRSYRYPVTAQALATELAVSVRTIYRDLEILRDQGANIQGEAGLGYVLQQDLSLPPLNSNQAEVEALVLGLRWVCRHTDSHLIDAAKHLYHKINQALPDSLQHNIENSPLLVGSHYSHQHGESGFTPEIHHAIQNQTVLELQYLDLKQQPSQRRIYPLGLAYFENIRLLIAWCEIRSAFRHFRLDRIQALHRTQEQYQPSRAYLMRQWFQETGIPLQDFYFDQPKPTDTI